MNKPVFLSRMFVQYYCIVLFTVVVSYFPSYAQLIPDGGITNIEWMQGTNQKIQWDTGSFHGVLTISVWNRATAAYTVLTTSATASAGEYTWSIPSTSATGDGFRIRVEENSDPTNYKASATFFSIVEAPPPPITTEVVGPQTDEQPQRRAPFTGSVGSFRLYPNPSDGVLTIDGAFEVEGMATFLITDILGAQVFSATEYVRMGSMSKQIDISHLAAGSYILRIQVDGRETAVNIVRK